MLGPAQRARQYQPSTNRALQRKQRPTYDRCNSLGIIGSVGAIELRGISGSTGCTLRPSWTWIEIYHQVAMAGTRNSQLVIKLAAISS